jgi:hypothetical protein
MLSKSSPSPPGRPDRKGQIFNLPLPTLVSGQDATGRVFQERTVLFYISDHGASFNLTNLVGLGAKLKLNIEQELEAGHQRMRRADRGPRVLSHQAAGLAPV